MRYPYWRCMACEVDIAEMMLPITPHTQVPVCPKCLRWENVDLVLGDDETVLNPDTVILDDESEGE